MFCQSVDQNNFIVNEDIIYSESRVGFRIQPNAQYATNQITIILMLCPIKKLSVKRQGMMFHREFSESYTGMR